MRSRFLGVALILVALAVSVNVLAAFTTATVTNGASVTVVTTQSAKLAMVAVDTDVASYSSGKLQLTFDNQQPDSTYTYSGVFKVVNNTSGSRAVSIDSVTGENGVHLKISENGGASTVLWNNGANGGASVTLNAAGELLLNVEVQVDSGATLEGKSLGIVVKGQ